MEKVTNSSGKIETPYEKSNNKVKIALIFAAVIVAYIIVNFIIGGKFLTFGNINLLITHSVTACFLAWAMSVTFTLQITDFSFGAIIILAANAAGYGGLAFGYPGLFISAILVGMLLMFVNFNIYLRTGIPSWIAGLGLALIYEAIGAYISKVRLDRGLQMVDLGNVCRDLLT